MVTALTMVTRFHVGVWWKSKVHLMILHMNDQITENLCSALLALSVKYPYFLDTRSAQTFGGNIILYQTFLLVRNIGNCCP